MNEESEIKFSIKNDNGVYSNYNTLEAAQSELANRKKLKDHIEMLTRFENQLSNPAKEDFENIKVRLAKFLMGTGK